MWEWVRSEILELMTDWLADAFSLSPLYAEEWTLMRFINTFLLVCGVAFLLAAGDAQQYLIPPLKFFHPLSPEQISIRGGQERGQAQVKRHDLAGNGPIGFPGLGPQGLVIHHQAQAERFLSVRKGGG